MRIVIQRVSEASVSVGGKVISKINAGMMILLGIEDADTEEDIEYLCNKLTKLLDDNEIIMPSNFHGLKVGEEVGSFYMIKMLGIY